ncbi:hypothetical protein BAE29_08985 [Acidithiobacillus caldus]|uniref:Uncharacterized protein n=1 Tax=Acidithiobacillus caldus TaxID=33059 RepID=A0A1E7YKK2_9PROT|nr:hypothetical protein BAE27_12370 [Acidithiobacillus caldus]OFC36879.1 hypothetical protein BAE28_08020 [Acidithiobacillus caldus]OFC38479.1 hypothetical protein BAE29_08985 [Acidithiobacillus caldus]
MLLVDKGFGRSAIIESYANETYASSQAVMEADESRCFVMAYRTPIGPNIDYQELPLKCF